MNTKAVLGIVVMLCAVSFLSVMAITDDNSDADTITWQDLGTKYSMKVNFQAVVTDTTYVTWTLYNNEDMSAEHTLTTYTGTAADPKYTISHQFSTTGQYFLKAVATNAQDPDDIRTTTVYYKVYVAGSPKLTFESNGGSSVSTMTVTYNSVATKPTNPTKTGCLFAGWYKDTNLTQAFDWTSNVTSSQTLYAKWVDATATTYTVTFNTNGGSSVASQTVVSGSVATKPTTDPTKTGFTFAGWYSNSTLTTSFVWTNPITSNTTVYAKWTENTVAKTTYTYSFNSNGGSAVSSITVNDGEKAVKPTDPTKTGYNFAGWYSDKDLKNAYDWNTLASKSMNLYAKWTEKTAADEAKDIIEENSWILPAIFGVIAGILILAWRYTMSSWCVILAIVCGIVAILFVTGILSWEQVKDWFKV